MSFLFCSTALQRWCDSQPSDAAAWRLAARSRRSVSFDQQIWPPSDCDESEDRFEKHRVVILMGLGMVAAAIRWCKRSPDHKALVVLVHAEELDALSDQPLFCDAFDQPGLTLHFWPAESMGLQWRCPAAALEAALEDRLLWGADRSSTEFLPQAQAVVRRALMVLAECAPASGRRLTHFWHNLMRLPYAQNYSALRGAAGGISVVIAGGGPSLPHALEWFKSNRARCLLFAGGAALQGCAEVGVEPDLAFLCDPTAAQWDRSKLLHTRAIPLVTTLCCHAPSVAAARGPLLMVPRPEEFPTGALAEHLLGLQSPILEGDVLDVGGLMTAFALFIGTSRILFAGRELCWDHQPYAHGSQELFDTPVQISGGDSPLWSTPHWVAVAGATRGMVERYPEIEWRHCGEQSLPIVGVDRQDLLTWQEGCHGAEKVEAFRVSLRSLPRDQVGMEQVMSLRREMAAGLLNQVSSQPGSQLTHRILQMMEGLYHEITQGSDEEVARWRKQLLHSLQSSWKS